MKALLLCLILPLTCLSQTIPNFKVVTSGVARGGTPDANGWRWLFEHGYTNVIKLNTDKESSDVDAVALGMTVCRHPITTFQQWFGTPTNALIDAVNDIQHGTFIHCGSDRRSKSWFNRITHTQGGQERTGSVAGLFLFLKCGATREQAFNETRSMGYHPGAGLWAAYELICR